MDSSVPSRAGGGLWSSEKLLRDLNTVGYTVIRSHFAPAEIQQLLASARKLTSAARSGAWPHLRTLPKQFPPWSSNAADGIWGVQHLLHPDLTTGPNPILTSREAAAFTNLYFGDAVIGPIKAILELPHDPSSDDTLMMELFNMLVAPPTPFSLRWHRDDVSFSLSPGEEASALGLLQFSQTAPDTSSHRHDTTGTNGTRSNPSQTHNPFAQVEESAYLVHPSLRRPTHTQYNIPLLPDNSLHLIPSSHLRPRTPTELSLLHHDAHSDALPNWIPLPLQPGDICFYNNNLIHRGVYAGAHTQGERYTLHGSVGRVDGEGGAVGRARNVLQHGVREWVERVEVAGLGRGGHDHGAGGGPEKALTPAKAVQAPAATVSMGAADDPLVEAAHGVTLGGDGPVGNSARIGNSEGGDAVDGCSSVDAEGRGRVRALRRRAEAMRRRLLGLGARSGDVGFAHDD